MSQSGVIHTCFLFIQSPFFFRCNLVGKCLPLFYHISHSWTHMYCKSRSSSAHKRHQKIRVSQGIVNSFVGVSQLLGQFWSLRPHARSSVQDSHNLMGLLRQEPQSGVPSTFYEYVYIYIINICVYIYIYIINICVYIYIYVYVYIYIHGALYHFTLETTLQDYATFSFMRQSSVDLM